MDGAGRGDEPAGGGERSAGPVPTVATIPCSGLGARGGHGPAGIGLEKTRDAAGLREALRVDGEVGLVGYEINFNRYFYEYRPPRSLEEIEADIQRVEKEIVAMLQEMSG